MHSAQNRAARVRSFTPDVNRIMTEGRVVHGCNGEELTTCHIKEGFGVKLLQTAGVKVATITCREQKIARPVKSICLAEVRVSLWNPGLPDEALQVNCEQRTNGVHQ